MKNIIALVILVCSSLAFAEGERATLSAKFSGRANGRTIELLQETRGRWAFVEWMDCVDCNPKDFQRVSYVTPIYLSNTMAADGNTVIQLSKTMVLTYVNMGMIPPQPDGKRPESLWKLEIVGKDGNVETIRMYLRGLVSPGK